MVGFVGHIPPSLPADHKMHEVVAFSLTQPSGPDQSNSRDVRPYVIACMSPPREIYHFRVSLRPLVNEHIPYIKL